MGCVQNFMHATFDDGMSRRLTTLSLLHMLFKLALKIKNMKL